MRNELTPMLVFKDFYTSSGLALNIMLEEGWGDGGYEIVSKDPDKYDLHWTGGKYGSGDHYAPRVFHPGFRGYHLMESVIRWGFVDKFGARIAKETSEYLEATKFR